MNFHILDLRYAIPRQGHGHLKRKGFGATPVCFWESTDSTNRSGGAKLRSGGKTFALLPQQLLLYRVISIPSGKGSRQRQALQAAMEQAFPFGRGELIRAALPLQFPSEGQWYLLAAAKRHYLQSCVDRVESRDVCWLPGLFPFIRQMDVSCFRQNPAGIRERFIFDTKGGVLHFAISNRHAAIRSWQFSDAEPSSSSVDGVLRGREAEKRVDWLFRQFGKTEVLSSELEFLGLDEDGEMHQRARILGLPAHEVPNSQVICPDAFRFFLRAARSPIFAPRVSPYLAIKPEEAAPEPGKPQWLTGSFLWSSGVLVFLWWVALAFCNRGLRQQIEADALRLACCSGDQAAFKPVLEEVVSAEQDLRHAADRAFLLQKWTLLISGIEAAASGRGVWLDELCWDPGLSGKSHRLILKGAWFQGGAPEDEAEAKTRIRKVENDIKGFRETLLGMDGIASLRHASVAYQAIEQGRAKVPFELQFDLSSPLCAPTKP
jgi:hypothetical protein